MHSCVLNTYPRTHTAACTLPFHGRTWAILFLLSHTHSPSMLQFDSLTQYQLAFHSSVHLST